MSKKSNTHHSMQLHLLFQTVKTANLYLISIESYPKNGRPSLLLIWIRNITTKMAPSIPLMKNNLRPSENNFRI